MLAVAVLATAFFSVASLALAASPGATAGVFRGTGNPDAIRAYEAWTGRPVYRVLDFLADDDWEKIASPTWWVDTWSASPYRTRMVYSVPMLPRSGGSLAKGATGAYDRHFKRLARLLVAKGQAGVTLRLGWEFNIDRYRWAAARAPARYAAYWRRIVAAMRSVPGAAFKFDWCANNGSVPWTFDPAKAYPGDRYVDFISVDVYDQSWPATSDPVRRWADIYGRRYGIKWLRGFASAHGKRVAFPEWGLGYNRHGGGDDPYFVAKMYDLIDRVAPAYHDVWEVTELPSLMGGRNPHAATKFLALFGA